MLMFFDVFNNPAVAIKNAKKQPNINTPLTIIAFSSIIVFITEQSHF